MDKLTKSYADKDLNRFNEILKHAETGHILIVSIAGAGDEIEIGCDTGASHFVCNKLLGEPLPEDTCVKDGREWGMRFKLDDTSRAHAERDYSDQHGR